MTPQATYTATVVGGIWWPYGAKATVDYTFTAEADLGAAEAEGRVLAGDFSSVDDMEITRRPHCGRCLQCQHDSPFCPYQGAPQLVRGLDDESALDGRYRDD